MSYHWPGSSYVLIVQLRLDEVSLAVILSVNQAGDTQSRQIKAIVCEAEGIQVGL